MFRTLRIASLAVLVALCLSGCGYNEFQRLDEQVKAGMSEVLNQYQRRADLIPNIVATVKGEVWTGSMLNDHVNRLDTNTGDQVHYLLPRPTNIRRVFVDEKGQKPVLWVGSNHGASIVKVEPLD